MLLNNLYVVPKIYGYTRVNLERGVNNSIEQGRLGTRVHSDRCETGENCIPCENSDNTEKRNPLENSNNESVESN